MSPFRSSAPPVRAQVVMIVVMVIGLVAIVAFKDRCVAGMTQGFGALAPPARDGGAGARLAPPPSTAP